MNLRRTLPAFLVALLLTAAVLPQAVFASAGFPRTVVDGLGHKIQLDQPPERIFSTGLAMTNILLSIVKPDRVVGVTHYATDPSQSYVVDKITDDMVQIDALNAEQILAADPDIVLVASWSDQDAVKQIRDLGLKVYTFNAFSTVQDALDNIVRMGDITGNEGPAQELVSGFYERYGRLAMKIAGVERPRVLAWDTWKSTTGVGTSMHDIIQMAGGINLAAENGISGWKEIGAEAIIKMNPDVMITWADDAFVQQVLSDPALQDVPAVKNKRVYHIDHTGALNQHFILAIEELAHKLHPERFQ